MVDFSKFSDVDTRANFANAQADPRKTAASTFAVTEAIDAEEFKAVNPLAGFVASAVTGAVEPFGVEASSYVQRYRRRNPGAGLTSQIAGLAVPYIGWELAASKAIGVAGKGLKLSSVGRVGQGGKVSLRQHLDEYTTAISKNAFTAGFSREALVFAPFEGARAISRLTLGDSPDDVAKGAGFDLAIAGVFGGAGNAVRSFGKAKNFMNEMGIEDRFAHAHDGLRAIRTRKADLEGLGQLDEPTKARFDLADETFVAHIRGQAPLGRDGRLVNPEKAKPTAANAHFTPAGFEDRLPEQLAVFEDLHTPGPTSGNAGIEVTEQLQGTGAAKTDNLKQASRKRKRKPPALPSTETQFLYPTPKGNAAYQTIESADEVFNTLTGKNFGEFADDIQYPRIIRPKSAVNATDETKARNFKQLRDWYNDNMTSVGKNEFILREQNDGNYLTAILDEPNQQVLTFKTSTPSDFLPHANSSMPATRNRMFQVYPARTHSPIGNEAFDEALRLKQILHPQMVDQTIKDGLFEAYLKKFAGVNPNGFLSKTGALIRRTLAPGDFRYKNPRAMGMFTGIRLLNEQVDAGVRRTIAGNEFADPTTTPISALLRGRALKGGLADDFRAIEGNPQQEALFVKAVDEGLSPKEAIKLGADEATVRLMTRMEELSTDAIQGLNTVGAQTDNWTPIEMLDYHYGIAREFPEWDVPIMEDGQVIHRVGADTKAEAEELAEEFLLSARADGKNWVRGDEVSALRSGLATERAATNSGDLFFAQQRDADNELKKYLKTISMRPATSGEWREFVGYLNSAKNSLRSKRRDVGGFTRSASAADVMDRFAKRFSELKRFEAKMAFDEIFQNDLWNLSVENLDEAKQLVKDLNITAGLDSQVGSVEQAFNDFASPFVSKNAALKTAQLMNSTMYTSTLGLGNVAYPAVNLLTWTQTSNPHIAWMMNIPPEKAQRFYSSTPLHYWQRRENYGNMHMLDPIKMAKAGMDMLAKPSDKHKELLFRNVLDGGIDNRMIEGYVGQNSILGDAARNSFQKGKVEKLFDGMNFMADHSERASRLHSFAQGMVFAEDVLGIEDADDLYRFARDFQRNTMFGYNTVDRPAIFRGVVGTPLGLFKNWVSHQAAWIANYAGDIGQGGGSALATMNAMTALVGGVGASQVGSFGLGLDKLLNGGNFSKDMYDPDNNALTDAFYYGVPSFLGVTLQGNAALPGSNFVRDVSSMWNFSQLSQAAMMVKSVGGGIDHWRLTGQAPWEDKLWTDKFIRATGVKNAYRVRQAVGQDGIRSLNTGNPIVTDMGIGDKMLFSMGLNPVELQKEYKLNDMVRKAQSDRSKRVAVFGRQYKDALDNGDHQQAFEIINNAAASGIPIDSLERSVKNRTTRQEQGLARASARSPQVRERFDLTDDDGAE